MKTLGCIHTSLVFINVETMMKDIFNEIMPDVRLINFVDDSLLYDVMNAGKVKEPEIERMCLLAKAAEISGCDAILSLCSSLGPSIDFARKKTNIPIVKIDDPMCEMAVQKAKSIGVMATVMTTIGPTVDLVYEKANNKGREIKVERSFVSGAFEKLMGGDKEAHDEMVQQQAIKLAKKVDIIVFAQASMTRLAPGIERLTGLEVMTSPRSCIEYTAKMLSDIEAEK